MADTNPEHLDMSLDALMRRDEDNPHAPSRDGNPPHQKPMDRQPRTAGGQNFHGGGRRGMGFRRGGGGDNAWGPGRGDFRRGGWNNVGFDRGFDRGRDWRGGGGAIRGQSRGTGFRGRGPTGGFGVGNSSWGGRGGGERRHQQQDYGDFQRGGRPDRHTSDWRREPSYHHQEEGFDPKNYENCTMDMAGGHVVIKQRGTEIVKVLPNGDIVLNSGNYRARSMLKALNDVLNLVSVQVMAHDNAPDDWSVKDGRSLMRFYDGLVLKAKGEHHQIRGQTILQAFSHPNRKAAVEATKASTLMAQSLGLLPATDSSTKAATGSSPTHLTQSEQTQMPKREWSDWHSHESANFPGHHHHHHHQQSDPNMYPPREPAHPMAMGAFNPESIPFPHPEFEHGPFDPWGRANWGGIGGGVGGGLSGGAGMGRPDIGFGNGGLMGEAAFDAWGGYGMSDGFHNPYGPNGELRSYASDAKIRRKVRQGRYQPY